MAEKTIQYEEVLNVRISEPEKALEDFQHWTQNTEEGYLELRNQFEIVWNKSKEMDLALDGDSKHQQQDETAKLRDLGKRILHTGIGIWKTNPSQFSNWRLN